MLRIYNTLARDKQDFVPIRAGEVRMYACGLTVYDYFHLGNARMLVAFDVVQRWLRASGYRVTYVRNITDIDDKILARAAEQGIAPEALAERYIRAMDEDTAALGVQRPDHEPRATQHVPAMLALIARLEQKGLAYRSPGGDVNYAVRKFPGYGRLSGKSLDELRAGERVEVDRDKNDPLDFVLWKRAKPGEPKWDSPWGAGRPGWHIECSAMSCQLLGEHFDIHGGGQDLQFPHHENEIAQSVGASGRPFVNYWMHNGFVRVDDEKMSKSLGNFFLLRDILRRYDAEVVRFFILRAHYRSALNYSDAHLDEAKAALGRLYTALKGFDAEPGPVDWAADSAKRFREAMDDDFNTPEAIAVLFDLANDVNRSRSASSARLLKSLAGTLGLLGRGAEAFLQGVAPTPESVQKRIDARLAARKAKNYAEADRIRRELEADGVILEDGPQDTTWRRA